MLATDMTAPRTRKPAATKPSPARSLAEIGREASRAARRKVLLSELKRQRWNLTATAEALSMGNSSNVSRAIVELDLTAEHKAAKDAGLIPMGPRS